jgi:hypothetical protein
MKNIYSRKFKVLSKPSRTINNPDIPKLQKHDVIFDIDYLGKLTFDKTKYESIHTYISKFFFKYQSEIFFDNGTKFELLSIKQAKEKIPKEFMVKLINNKDKEVNIPLRDYFESKYFLQTPDTKLTIDYKEPVKYFKDEFVRGFTVKYNYLNFKKDLPVDYTQVIKETLDFKESVDLFFNHIKEVLCSNNEYEFEIVCKFFAASCAGHKLKFCLYLEDMKNQTGKGTVINKMLEILGDRAFKTSSIEQVESYTKNFEGRCLINLDEIPINGVSKQFQDKMKGLITEDYFDCREMYNSPYSQKNTFNILLSSNNSSISLTQTNQKRYFMPTISDKYQDNEKYFKNLHKKINRPEVNILIFQRFMKIYEEQIKPNNWIGNCLKQTSAVISKSINALPHFMKWIKTRFLQRREAINIECNELFSEYELTTQDKTAPNKLSRYLSDFGVEVKRVSGTSKRKYILSYENLLKSYYDKNWLDPITDYELIEEYENMHKPKEQNEGQEEQDEIEELRKLEQELDKL